MSWIGWIIIGCLAGWLAGKTMRGGGFGFFVNVLVGLAGSFVGGWIFDKFGWITGDGGFNIWSLITAFVGACLLLWIISFFKRK